MKSPLPILGFAVLCLASAGCSGILFISDEMLQGGEGGEGGVECTASTDCDGDKVCVGYACIDPEDVVRTCRPSMPTEPCLAGRDCAAGVCVPDGETWCGCPLDKVCLAGDCLDPVGQASCSSDNPAGYCPTGGVCIPIITRNECEPERTDGLCPNGSVCIDGYCIPLEDEEVIECSVQNTDGLCPAGQRCDAGECVDAMCSPSFPFGVCLIPDTICVEGICEEVGNLLTCADLGCPGLNREACAPESEPPVCGDCIAGHYPSATDQCLPETCTTLGCVLLFRDCDDDGDFAVCTDCLGYYHDDGAGLCVPDGCDELDCDLEHRVCEDTFVPVTCGDCVAGYHEDLSACVPDSCLDIDCGAQFRVCYDSGEFAVCGPCETNYNENSAGECVACFSTAECPAQYYCSDSEGCVQDCVPPDNSACAANEICAPTGRCVPFQAGGDYCAAAVAEGELVEPTIQLLIDRSGSMGWGFPTNGGGNPSRWSVLHDALFGDGASNPGVLIDLESDVRFGETFYTSANGSCPSIIDVPPTLDNYTTMHTAYDNTAPSAGTPTGESIDIVVADLLAIADSSPKYIVVATDGEPYTCADLSGSETAGRNAAVQAARDAWGAGIRLFIISVGADIADQHLQDMANAGAGVAEPWPTLGDAGNADFWKATDPAGLSTALSEVIGSVLSCVIELDADDPSATPALGDLYIDGEKLTRNDPNGWVLTSNTTVVLQGTACDLATDGDEHFIWVAFTLCTSGG